MQRWGLKFELAMTTAVLLAIGMLLTDFVAASLWSSEVNQRERQQLRQYLAFLLSQSQRTHRLQDADAASLAELARQGICLVQIFHGNWAQPAVNTCGEDALLLPRIKTVALHRAGPDIQLNSGRYFIAASPDQATQTNQSVLALVKRVDGIGPRLFTHQGAILIYILVNIIILTVIAFFRFSRQIFNPLDKLVAVADNYQEYDRLHFTADHTTNEMAYLATSLNGMVFRIESDRAALKNTVAELAEKNRQLQQNQDEMIRTEKLASVGRLAAGLAHEIGNPLSVAQGYLQLMQMGGGDAQEHREYAARAFDELQRVDNLIRQLLGFARTSKNELQLFDIHSFLADMMSALAVQPFLHGIECSLRLEAQRSLVFADKEHLRQVLLNCLLNAADAIKAKGARDDGRIVIQTVLEESENDTLYLRVDISDNGAGIVPELLDTVFDPFFTTKEPGSGTGLGLAVSLLMIESMGGRIQLQSELGHGTTIQLFVPLTAQEKEMCLSSSEI